MPSPTGRGVQVRTHCPEPDDSSPTVGCKDAMYFSSSARQSGWFDRPQQQITAHVYKSSVLKNLGDNLALKRKPDILYHPQCLAAFKMARPPTFPVLQCHSESDRTETELRGRFPLFEIVSEGERAAEELEVPVMVQYAPFCLSQDQTNS